MLSCHGVRFGTVSVVAAGDYEGCVSPPDGQEAFRFYSADGLVTCRAGCVVADAHAVRG